MSACCSAPGDVRNRNVLDWRHLQFLLPASPSEQNTALWICVYPCYGRRIDGSYLDGAGGVNLQDRPCALGSTQGTKTISKESRSSSSTAETTARTTSHAPVA